MPTRPPGVLCFLTVFLAAIALVRSAPGQDPDEDSAVLLKLHGRVTSFLDGIPGDEQKKAFDELLTGSQLAKKPEDVKTLIARTKEIEKKYGKFQEAEPISAQKIGKDLVLLKYLFKCESFPVVWYFTYYKDFSRRTSAAEDDKWVIIAVKFDTQLEALATPDERKE